MNRIQDRNPKKKLKKLGDKLKVSIDLDTAKSELIAATEKEISLTEKDEPNQTVEPDQT